MSPSRTEPLCALSLSSQQGAFSVWVLKLERAEERGKWSGEAGWGTWYMEMGVLGKSYMQSLALVIR